jgi:hypothetical protein
VQSPDFNLNTTPKKKKKKRKERGKKHFLNSSVTDSPENCKTANRSAREVTNTLCASWGQFPHSQPAPA